MLRDCLQVLLLAAGVGAFLCPHHAASSLKRPGSASAAARSLLRRPPAPLVPIKMPRRFRAGVGEPGALRSSEAGRASQTLPTEESLRDIPMLQQVALSARKAVEQSTGEGTESSGQGRYEWGRHPAKCQLVPLHVYTYTHPHRCDELDFKRTA